MENKAFYCIKGHLPKFELKLETENLLLGWETLSNIRSASDYLSITFKCEFGHVQITSSESLAELFEALQMERPETELQNNRPGMIGKSGLFAIFYQTIFRVLSHNFSRYITGIMLCLFFCNQSKFTKMKWKSVLSSQFILNSSGS
jgi:hypothetical protein